MSEPLFAALLLGALAAAIQHRRSTHRWRWVLLAGVLGRPDHPHARQRAGAAAAARARGLDRPAALLAARAGRARRCSSCSRCSRSRRGRSATRSSSTASSRSARSSARRSPAPTTTRRALDKENPASWRSIRHLPEYRALYARLRRDPRARGRGRACASARRPTSASTRPTSARSRCGPRCARSSSAGWTGRATRRRRSASTPRWANAGVICFWIFALLALAGAFTQAARRDAVVRLADPGAALPERGLPRRRDPALPHGHRPVHRHARGAGATTSTSSRPRTVHALDAIELDIRRRRRPRHQRDRPPGARPPRRARATASGTDGDDLLLVDHAQVEVGHERQRAAARALARRRARSCPVSAIPSAQPVSTPSSASSVARVERRVVGDELDAVERRACPTTRSAPCAAQDLGHAPRSSVAGGHAVHGRLVVGDPLAEQVDVDRRRARRRGSRAARRAPPARVAERRADSRPSTLSPRVAHATTPGTSASGTSGSSRIVLQPGTGSFAQRAAAELRELLRPLVALARARRPCRRRPSRAARGRCASSPPARRGRAGGSAPTGCRS